MMEGVIPYLESLTGGEALMGILTNYATDCLATAECRDTFKVSWAEGAFPVMKCATD